MNFEDKLRNGCTKKETLDLHELLSNSPHCNTSMMFIRDGVETVAIGFDHYQDSFVAYFNSTTGIAELFIEFKIDEEWTMEYYGDITSLKLKELFDKLPHVNDYLI